MAMWNLESSDDHPNSTAAIVLLLSQPNLFCDKHKVACSRCWKVDPLVDFLNRNNQGVTGCNWVDSQKRYADLVFVNKMARYLSADNAGKQGSHSEDCSVGDREN